MLESSSLEDDMKPTQHTAEQISRHCRIGPRESTLWLSTDHPEGTRRCCGGDDPSIASVSIASGSMPSSKSNASPSRVHRKHSPPMVATAPNHVWAYDFVEDPDVHGNVLRILPLMDKFTCEGLDIDAANSTSAERVISRLEHLVGVHGAPAYLRSDNGPE